MNSRTPEQRRAERAAYMRRWRASKAESRPEPTPDDSVDATGDATAGCAGTDNASGAPAAVDAAPADAPAGVRPQTDAEVEQGLFAVLSAATGLAHLMLLPDGCPEFGERRARDSAHALAPVLAPYCREADWAKTIATVLACAVPAAHMVAWRGECVRYIAAKEAAELAAVVSPARQGASDAA